MCAHLVGLEKCCQTYIYLQNFVLIQPSKTLQKNSPLSPFDSLLKKDGWWAARGAPRNGAAGAARWSAGAETTRCSVGGRLESRSGRERTRVRGGTFRAVRAARGDASAALPRLPAPDTDADGGEA